VAEGGRLRSRFCGILLLGLGLLVHPACHPAVRLTPSDAYEVLNRHSLDAPDPGERGAFDVLTLYYGSGTDQRRPEYRDSVAIVTPTVDASKLVSLGESADERNEYWGFTPREMPLNARVWYPDGEGPFPLVLVVHGNHDMRDFSDPGYDYLGELLASRGHILASVDENFLNGGIRGENDARGWFLLQHLHQFSRFHEEEGNPFFGKVDMDRIALIGHSRGGEAVANAAAFNRLSRYPDDANITFDFGFGIRGIISIAPVDGQYLPTGRKVVAEDVSYLTFHGSHDGDVTSFHGLRIYDRIKWNTDGAMRSAGVPKLKAAVYVYRANHGQWNTVWGAHDRGPRSGRSLDLRSLISAEEQRRFAELYVSAFLELVLKENTAYLPLFRDHRVIGSWLPKTMYVTRFETDGFRELAGFEEDFDVESGSVAGVKLRGDSLSTWRESTLHLRSSNRANTSASQETQAVTVGWGPPDADEEDSAVVAAQGEGGGDVEGSASMVTADTAESVAGRAIYAVELGGRLAARWALGPAHSFDFTLSPSRPDDGEGNEDDEPPPMGELIQVEAVDAAGRVARVALGRYGPVRPPMEIYILRRRDQERQRYSQRWELIPQSYSIPLGDFVEVESALDLRQLTELRFSFDRRYRGEVVLDRIGLSELHPDFWRAR